MKKSLILFPILLLCFSNLLCTANAIPAIHDQAFINDKLAVETIAGWENVPKFLFWNPNDADAPVYQVQFIHFFEAIDENNDGMYQKAIDQQVPASVIALPSWDWDFSDILTIDNVKHMNITSVDEEFEIQFRIHFGSDASMKFDIVVRDYVFVSSADNVLLVLGWHLISTKNTAELQIMDRNRLNIGGDDAYIKSDPVAFANQEQVNAQISSGDDEGQPMAYISYERFDGDLIHDPIIGLGADYTIWIIVGVGSGLLIAVIGIVIYRKKICVTGGNAFLCQGVDKTPQNPVT